MGMKYKYMKAPCKIITNTIMDTTSILTILFSFTSRRSELWSLVPSLSNQWDCLLVVWDPITGCLRPFSGCLPWLSSLGGLTSRKIRSLLYWSITPWPNLLPPPCLISHLPPISILGTDLESLLWGEWACLGWMTEGHCIQMDSWVFVYLYFWMLVI